MTQVFRFRSLQQKLGFYAFVLSFGAMLTVSVLSYRVASDQVREDRVQLMGVYAQQIAGISNANSKMRRRSYGSWEKRISCKSL
jgi:hypothetical protein